MTWDVLRVEDWSQAARPQPFVLCQSTIGCGCCSESHIIYTADKARQAVATYITEREEELVIWRDWLNHMATADEILK